MGSDGAVRIAGSVTIAAGVSATRRVKVYFGGVAVWAPTFAAGTGAMYAAFEVTITNRGVANSQICSTPSNNGIAQVWGLGVGTTALVTTNIDTTQDVALAVAAITDTSGGGLITLERSSVELLPSYASVPNLRKVKVAVLDAGFAGFDGKRPYLPANTVLVEHYDPAFVARHNLGDPAFQKPFLPGDAHGRLMAQVVWATTGNSPDGPQFFLLNANGPTMFRRAVRYAVEQKVDVILFCGTFEGAGNYDGRAPIDTCCGCTSCNTSGLPVAAILPAKPAPTGTWTCPTSA